LNPYTLRLIVNHLVKQNSPILTSSKEMVSTLLYQLAYMTLYFQGQKALVVKLQKSLLKLIAHVRGHQELFLDQVKAIAQNYAIRFITKQIDFKDESSDGKHFSAQQLLFLEIHLQLGYLREEMNEKYDLNIGKFLEDSEELATIKKYIQIVREKGEFNLLKYLYHLDNLEVGQLETMNQTIETNHPVFKGKTRTFIDFPEVQRVTIKVKEST
jgi:hypothetical protein